MKPPVIFLNELSCGFEDIHDDNMHVYIIRSIQALKAVVDIRNDLVLGSSIPIPNLEFGELRRPLAAVLGTHRLEIRYLMNLARTNPWSPAPGSSEEIRYNGNVGGGLTLAAQNDTAALSFGYNDHWNLTELLAERYSIDDEGNEDSTPASVPNISRREDVAIWRSMLLDYGFQEAVSSTIYRSASFSISMFLNDHEPPHIHIQHLEERRTLGKLRIDNLEMLDKRLPKSIETEVTTWVLNNQTALLQSWSRCREGRLPLAFN